MFPIGGGGGEREGGRERERERERGGGGRESATTKKSWNCLSFIRFCFLEEEEEKEEEKNASSHLGMLIAKKAREVRTVMRMRGNKMLFCMEMNTTTY